MKKTLASLLIAGSMMYCNAVAQLVTPTPTKTQVVEEALFAVPEDHLKKEGNLENKSAMSDIAYMRAGSFLCGSVSKLNFKHSGKVEKKPFELDIDWKKQKEENPEMPYTDFVSLDYKNTKGALTAFNIKYIKSSDELFKKYFEFVKNDKFFQKSVKKGIAENEEETKKNSAIFYVSFPEKSAQLIWYVGDRYFYGGLKTKENGLIKTTPEEIKTGNSHKKIKNAEGLLSIFNGTFSRIDSNGIFRWDYKDHLDWKKIYSPLATIAFYEDGTFQLKRMSDLQNKEKIRHYIQNMLMIVQDGIPQEGAKTRFFSRYLDNFTRSYLFKDNSGNFGFLWTTYTPPYVLAELAPKMNISDMVLLDVHSPVGCSLTNPGAEIQYANKKHYLENSFRFIPNFGEVSSAYKPVVGLSQLLNRNIQNDFVNEAFSKKGAWEDFFAIYEKDAPEVIARQKSNIKNVAKEQ